ncbi:NAD-dependent epimerase/dehydratase family protein [Streptomyces sp. NPDC048603]|uniref:NAD-dependent epimerase/dehydratase family protein n=1 Tax=Streptomyces sp. NPDC048603 TaxID=3365577 RepID=UPI00371C5216
MRTPDRRDPAGLSVVVLGGAGFLGRHIAEAFTAAGATVHPVSRSGPHGLDLLAAPTPDITAFLARTRADVVVNAAGRAWRADEAQMAAGNHALVDRVVTALAALPDARPRLIQLGSVHEYGAGAPGAPTPEDHEPAPVTPYGRTKLLGTRAVLSAARDRGLDGVVLRLANVIGPGVPEGSLFGKVAAHLGGAARALARGERADPLRLPPLRAARDLVDTADAVDAVLAAATAGAGVAGRVINVGRGEAVPMRQLIDRMVALSGLPVPVTEEAAAPAHRTDVDRQCLDVSLAGRLLGWRPRRDLDASLRDLLAAVVPQPGTAA